MIDQYSHESRTTNALHTPSASQQAACLRTLGPLALAVRALHCSDAACTQAMRQPARTGAVSTTAQLRLTLGGAVPAVLQRQWTPLGKSCVNFGCHLNPWEDGGSVNPALLRHFCLIKRTRQIEVRCRR